MKKKNIKIVFFILLAVVSLNACTAGFDDINTNPYEVTKKELNRDGYNINSYMIGLQSTIATSAPHLNQFAGQLMGGNWGRYTADSNPGFNHKNFASYKPTDGWIKPIFADNITNTFKEMGGLEAATDNKVLLSVALICKVASLHRVTDIFGPMPYSRVGEDGKLQIPYDSQEQVYKRMFKELDSAITVLADKKNINERFSLKADKVYDGEIRRWVKFANSLKLRLAMRLAYVNEPFARKMAEEACKTEGGNIGTMTDNIDNATYSNFGKDGNPLYLASHVWNGGDARVCADITSYMTGYEDPRSEKYFLPSTFKEVDNGFVGLRSGIMIPSVEKGHAYSNFNLTSSSPLIIMNAAETAFLKAEGKLRGWNVGAKTAKEFYEEGIALSFKQWGAAGIEKYIEDDTRLPLAYKDPLQDNTYSGNISTITIAWKDDADFEQNLERIITQKWIANFPFLGIEAWSEHRRTGYPKFMNVAINNSLGLVDTGFGPRRLNYPQSEISTNAENVQKAVAEYLNGPDNLATRVWWDCKNKK